MHRNIRHTLLVVSLMGGLLAGCEAAPSSAPAADPSRIQLTFELQLPNPLPDMPEGTDLSRNPWMDLIRDRTQADILVKDSGPGIYKNNVPDILDSSKTLEAYTAARDGIFLDLKPFYDASPTLQQAVPPALMEFAKESASGKYWRIPIPNRSGAQGAGIIARYDLVKKYNGGRWPATVDEWIELLRKLKKAEPKSVPMSNWVNGDELLSGGGVVFFNLLGANPTGFRIQGGHVIPNVLLPEYKAAVEIYRQLYAEGIFDPEFATIKFKTQWDTKWATQNVLFQWGSVNQLVPGLDTLTGTDVTLAFAPSLTSYPPAVSDPRYAKGFLDPPITGQGLYVSAKSKHPAEAFQVIESLASPEFGDALRRAQQPSEAWSRIYGLFYRSSGQATPARSSQDGIAQRQSEAEANGYNGLFGYIAPYEASKKKGFANQAISEFTAKAIMGRITMDQLDQELKKWEKDYLHVIYDPMQSYLEANKAHLLRLGVKMAGW